MARYKKVSPGRRRYGGLSVGILLLLVAAGMQLLPSVEANPAVVLLVALVGAGCILWGFRRRDED